MQFSIKDFEQLHITKTKLCINEPKTICSDYFFCVDNRMILINKSKKYYQILATPQCNFKPLVYNSVLQVIYGSTDLADVIRRFYDLVKLLVDWRSII